MLVKFNQTVVLVPMKYKGWLTVVFWQFGRSDIDPGIIQ